MKPQLSICLIITLLTFILHPSSFNAIYAQGVSINETGAIGNSNSILDVSSDDKGLLIPRLAAVARTTLGTALGLADEGMLVYDKDLNEIYHWDGTQWVVIGSSANTDNQNISGSGLSGTDLTIGIEDGSNEVIDLSSLVNDADSVVGNEYVTNFSIINDSLVISDNGSTKKVALTDINAADWHKLGNGGTNPTTDFVGTTDAQDLVFRTNNAEELRILSNGNVGIGTSTPGAALEVSSTNSGILIPQINLIDTSDVATITNPANSLLVYNTNDTMKGGNGVGYYQWDTAATKWLYMITSPNGPGSDGDVLTSKGSGLPPTWKAAGGGSSGGCTVRKRVFVTSTTYDGNLGGFAGADAKCQARADAASLGGTWKAILSIGTVNSPITSRAKGRIGNDWDILTDIHGTPVESSNDLWDQSGVQLNSALEFDEFGNFRNTKVWTGTERDGNSSGVTCNDWTSNSSAVSGIYGESRLPNNGWWIERSNDTCENTYSLYCVEH